MKLGNLYESCDDKYKDIEIFGLSIKSAEVTEGDLYFCIKGTKTDGHNFGAEAQSRGAAALVVEYFLDGITVPQILVRDVRSALSVCSARFFDDAASKLKIIGITGTNGKTTTSYILKSILEAAGKRTGIIGTTATMIGDEVQKATLTTPDPIELHAIFKRMVDAGLEYCVMEVSAHALKLNKVLGIRFEVVGFTNLSQDHLDFFPDMESYFAAKKKLFSSDFASAAVINIDDEYGRRLCADADIPVLTYGYHYPSDVFALDLSMSVGGLEYIINLCDDIAEVKFNLPGKFNMYNTLLSAALAHSLGISTQHIVKGIRSLKKVEGRFNIINTTKGCIIIDFAHTDDGLRNILQTIREFSFGRIITVFGCGGNRDRFKRPKMGRLVAELSDYCIITSDNPRFENPFSILSDIENGVLEGKKRNYCIIEDRRRAISKAVSMAEDGDIVLIAGKGAERYQDIQGIKMPYNDEEYVLELIEEKKI